MATGAAQFFRLTMKIRKSGLEVIVEACKIGSTGLPHFLDDGVFGHGDAFRSSWGVQMIGGSNPCSLHTNSILGRRVAFAKWRQFQVSR